MLGVTGVTKKVRSVSSRHQGVRALPVLSGLSGERGKEEEFEGSSLGGTAHDRMSCV